MKQRLVVFGAVVLASMLGSVPAAGAVGVWVDGPGRTPIDGPPDCGPDRWGVVVETRAAGTAFVCAADPLYP